MIRGKPLLLALYLFCGLVVAACTTTPRPSQSAQVAAAAPAPETLTVVVGEPQPADASQEVICKTFTPTGTRFQKQVCGTQAQWDRLKQDGRETGEWVQRKGVQVGNPTSD